MCHQEGVITRAHYMQRLLVSGKFPRLSDDGSSICFLKQNHLGGGWKLSRRHFNRHRLVLVGVLWLLSCFNLRLSALCCIQHVSFDWSFYHRRQAIRIGCICSDNCYQLHTCHPKVPTIFLPLTVSLWPSGSHGTAFDSAGVSNTHCVVSRLRHESTSSSRAQDSASHMLPHIEVNSTVDPLGVPHYDPD